MVPLGRFGLVDERTDAAVLLASNTYVRGQAISVKSGMYLCREPTGGVITSPRTTRAGGSVTGQSADRFAQSGGSNDAVFRTVVDMALRTHALTPVRALPIAPLCVSIRSWGAHQPWPRRCPKCHRSLERNASSSATTLRRHSASLRSNSPLASVPN